MAAVFTTCIPIPHTFRLLREGDAKMRRWTIPAVLAIAAVTAATKLGLFGAQNPVEAKARRDEAFVVRTGDAEMEAARQKGRATLDRFLAVRENPPANARAFSLKVPVRDGDKVEWFWVGRFSNDGGRFRGIIDNTPRSVSTVRQGQEISFARDEIADWMYVQDGKVRGNFTACALLAKEPDVKARTEFIRKFGLECSA
jgi:uncharacterized protein YegJ (DUF2314 family)